MTTDEIMALTRGDNVLVDSNVLLDVLEVTHLGRVVGTCAGERRGNRPHRDKSDHLCRGLGALFAHRGP